MQAKFDNCFAIIPARGGSKGIPGKNLKLINGLTLVERSISAAKKAGISNIVVSSDSRKILDIARKKGCIAHERSEINSSDTATTEEVIVEVINNLRNKLNDEVIIILIQPTSPFINSEDIVNSIRKTRRGISTFTAFENHNFNWQTKEDQKEIVLPIGHSKTKRLRRQDMPSQFTENGACYSFTLYDFKKTNSRFSSFCEVVKMPKYRSIEIDCESDLEESLRIGKTFFCDWEEEKLPNKPKIIFSDFDGCMTDDKVLVSENGEEHVLVNRKDGMAIRLLHELFQVSVVVTTSETNKVVQKRCEKLSILCLHSLSDKWTAIKEYCEKERISLENCWYVGNDINDLEAVVNMEYSLCPSDSNQKIIENVKYKLVTKGGEGIFQEILHLVSRIQQ